MTVNQAGASVAKTAIGSASIKGVLSGNWQVTGVSGATRDSAAGKIQADDIAIDYGAAQQV